MLYFVNSKMCFSHVNISEISVFNNWWHSLINYFLSEA